MKIAILEDDQDAVRTLDAEDLAAMSPDAMLINTSRAWAMWRRIPTSDTSAMPSTTCWLRCSDRHPVSQKSPFK